MRIGRSVGLLLVLCAVGLAPAAPYWIAWEGDDWPENQGWTRDIYGNPSKRSLENGVMTLDGMETGGGWDGYRRALNGNLDPDPGELLVLRWRMRVEAVDGSCWDPIFGVASDDAWSVSFLFAVDAVWSLGENVVLNFAPGEFHAWELRSWDMRQYELRLDGEVIRRGQFLRLVLASDVTWGDGSGVTRSRSSWDYVRFGVVPEVETSRLVVVLGLMVARVRRL